jgi:hypothetical protein
MGFNSAFKGLINEATAYTWAAIAQSV